MDQTQHRGEGSSGGLETGSGGRGRPSADEPGWARAEQPLPAAFLEQRCRALGHPQSRLAGEECLCGAVRYD
jgi:hypothetical protein